MFLKPTSSYLENGGTIQIPHPWGSLDHEVELAVVIGQKARDVPEATAMDFVAGTFLNSNLQCIHKTSFFCHWILHEPINILFNK